MNNKFSLAFVLVVFCATSTFCAPTEDTRLKRAPLRWRSVPGDVACGGQAKTARQIVKTIREELQVTKYDFVIFVAAADEHGFSYRHRGSLTATVDRRNLCGWDILMFRRKKKLCPSSLANKLAQLQRSAASDSNTHPGVADIIKERDEDYGLIYDLIITYKNDSSSSWSAYVDKDCYNWYDAGNPKISSFVVAHA